MPEAVLSNTDLEKLVDTNDDWIATRTGIRLAPLVIKSHALWTWFAYA